MVSKCANPNCSTPFQYLRDGKVFQIEVEANGDLQPADWRSGPSKKTLHVEHFWLCGRCSNTYTLGFQKGRGIITVPLKAARGATAA